MDISILTPIKSSLIKTEDPYYDIKDIIEEKYKDCFIFLDEKVVKKIEERLYRIFIWYEKDYVKYIFPNLDLYLRKMDDKWYNVIAATLYKYDDNPYRRVSCELRHDNINIPKEIIFIKMKEE